MASTIPLNQLIEALAGAVINAQENIENQQLRHLAQYFDANRRPKSLTVRVPSMRPEAEPGEDDLYRAPLLPLLPPSPLHIKDVEIAFDTELGQLEDETAKDGAPKGKNVSVDIAGSGGKAGSVHIVMHVESVEQTEGAARLLNHLAQTQGVVNKPHGDATKTKPNVKKTK